MRFWVGYRKANASSLAIMNKWLVKKSVQVEEFLLNNIDKFLAKILTKKFAWCRFANHISL